jgi:hypothetical protein
MVSFLMMLRYLAERIEQQRHKDYLDLTDFNYVNFLKLYQKANHFQAFMCLEFQLHESLILLPHFDLDFLLVQFKPLSFYTQSAL